MSSIFLKIAETAELYLKTFMKRIIQLLVLLLVVACTSAKDRSFTGSTPAGKELRQFLGIDLADSVDFIRWKLTLNDRQFSVECNYGIGKPNTNGFYNGGQWIKFKDKAEWRNGYYRLQNGSAFIDLLELNDNLLHFKDATGLLTGNGGWSYTLNNTSAVPKRILVIQANMEPIADSMVYIGRTPCKIPGLAVSANCYKIKWKVVLYPGKGKDIPGHFTIYGTNWRKDNLEGTWELAGQTCYILKDKTGNTLFHLQKLEELLFFTDNAGNLLVGDKDFSYTLNRQ
jgi:hypothetical protein